VSKPTLANARAVPPLPAEECKNLIYSVLSESQRARFEDAMELDCSLGIDGVARFRVNVFQQKNGVAGVFRTISSSIPTPTEIGLMPAMANLIDLPRVFGSVDVHTSQHIHVRIGYEVVTGDVDLPAL